MAALFFVGFFLKELYAKCADILESIRFVFTSLQFGPALGKGLDGHLHIFDVVHGGGDQAEQDVSLGYHRVNYHGTEDAVVLTQVEDQIGGLNDSA